MAFPQVNDIEMGDPAPWPQGEETTWEMNAILEETLECTACDTTVTREMMNIDIATGKVDLRIDPSFLVEPKEEPIGPFDDPEPKTHCSGYLNGASIDQIARYKEKSGTTDLEAYAMQRHLHQHRIGRQGFANFCRNFDEVEDVRGWSFRVAYMDGDLHSEDEMDLDNGWPSAQEDKSMPDQEQQWFLKFDEREEREKRTRRKWGRILRAREKQRRAALKAEWEGDMQAMREARRREKRAAERRAQHHADLAWKAQQEHIMYCQLVSVLKDREQRQEQ